jgi:putative ATP-binding cassette transporter
VAGFMKSLATVWRLGIGYFHSDDRRRGLLLLLAVIAIELGLVAVTVMLNRWYNGFYNALQDRNSAAFVLQIAYFCGIATAATLLNVYKLYSNQWLEIRWRRWMTASYLDHWLTEAMHYRMQLTENTTDNPDQRIAEDIKLFVEQTLAIGLGLLNSVASVGSFVVILWGLSNEAPLRLPGMTFAIPGYLVWAALIYALAGTIISHLVGRPLIGLNFNQQRYEADFRFSLVRVRENSEQIALLAGETLEADRLHARFDNIVGNWHRIMSRQMRLTFLTASYGMVGILFPFVVVSPAYFAGAMQLGGLVQTSAAFATVQVALSFFVTIYPNFAQWCAVIARLDGFDRSIKAARSAAATPSSVNVVSHPENAELTIDNLEVQLPSGGMLVATHNIAIKAGERALITGPSGSGKSTFFRALAGVWPFGTGTIVVPKGARLMVLPQRPYFTIGSLEQAVSYPSMRGTFPPARVAEVLGAVGLPALALRLSEEAHWTQTLSLGEQQRLSIARAILHAPDFLFLDEATASLDEPSEAHLYALLKERLPEVTVVSIGHRSTLAAFHDRRLALHAKQSWHHISEIFD